MESITRFITQELKLKGNETKSAVARPQERKFLGFSFTAGPGVRRVIAPKALDRFKQRIREITRRAKSVSMKTTMEELAPFTSQIHEGVAHLETIVLHPPEVTVQKMAKLENGARMYGMATWSTRGRLSRICYPHGDRFGLVCLGWTARKRVGFCLWRRMAALLFRNDRMNFEKGFRRNFTVLAIGWVAFCVVEFLLFSSTYG
jgi:hypothetical protein